MKIGICINMNASEDDGIGLESLETVKNAGFDYVEAPAAQLLALEPKALKKAVISLKDCDLPVLAMNNLFQAGIRLTGPDADKKRIDDYIDRVVELASELGVETMVFGSSEARNVPMHFSTDEAWDQLLGMLSRLGDKASAIGATVVIEHLNHLESNIVDWFREGVRLVNELEHTAVRCLVDLYHLVLGNEPLDLVRKHIGLVHHVHFANVLWRTIPTCDLHESHGMSFLDLLRDVDYQHKLSVEGYCKDLERVLPESLDFIQRSAKM